MKNNSQIFTQRTFNEKQVNRIRFFSTALTSKKEIPKIHKAVRPSKSTFKDNNKFNFPNDKITLPKFKFQIQTQISSSVSPRGKSSKAGVFKLCASNNVCVFSNLKSAEANDQFQQIKKKVHRQKNKFYDQQHENKNFFKYDSLSPRFKKIKNLEFSKTSGCAFELRKVASSQSCREEKKSQQKIFDPWHIENHGQDPDIIFYK